MRRVEQAEILQVGHDVADGGGRQRLGELAGERPRANRLAGLDIAFDDVAQDLAGTLIQLGDRSGLPLARGTIREDRPRGTDTMNGHAKNVGSVRGPVNAGARDSWI